MASPLRRLALLLVLGTSAAASASELPALIAEPPAARPGECWTTVLVPPVLERRSESVLKTPATVRLEPVPARYEWVEETVVKPAGEIDLLVEPAVYETREEQVLVSPARTVEKRIPPRYRYEEVKVPVQQGTTLRPNAGSEALCVVEAPVAWRIERRRVLVEPARVETLEQPARYKTVVHKTKIKDAVTRRVQRGERRITRRVKQLVEPASTREVPVPAVYETVETLVQVQPPRSEWRAVLCGTNADREQVRQLQAALAREGFDPGPVDGALGRQTQEALLAYQQARGLAPLGFTRETLDRLGIAPPG